MKAIDIENINDDANSIALFNYLPYNFSIDKCEKKF